MSLQKGRVYKSTGSWYIVRDEQGQFWNARIIGKFKIDKSISSSNPIAVGDVVMFEVENEDEKVATIKSISDRENYIVRVSPQNRNQKHIIASNIDAAVVIATIANPRTSTGFIDRFLITAEAYHIPAIIIVNKTDLLKDKHKAILEEWREMYENIGYEFYAISALEKEDVQRVQNRIAGNSTLFCGHSGVGKSTIINKLVPDKELKTQEISDWSGKGQHTTTFAEMFDLEDGSIIDTPGVKEFGLINIEQEELAQYFPEMRALMGECKFNNCLHTNEPDCKVKEAVINGTLWQERYANYVTILDTIEKNW